VSYRQAIEEVMQLLSGQWVAAVLAALALGPLHFSEVLHEVNAVEEELGSRTHARPLSGKVLARTLDRMERDGLVNRYETRTPSGRSVCYELTHTGQSLLAVLRPVAQWVQTYQAEQLAADDRLRANGTGAYGGTGAY
jgi:DNA-binding HxlR family transcriptional regulator